jgi:uncharacterized protein (TIRG00374 family)
MTMLQQDSAVLDAAAEASAPARSARGLWMSWTGIALSVVCLALALRGTDLREIGATLATAHLWLALPLLLAHVPFYWVKAVRWRMLLAPVRSTPAAPLLAPMMIGFMGNNLLPARLGELIRMYLGARFLGVTQSQVLATLVLERLFDFIAVLVFFGFGVVVLGNVPAALVKAGYVASLVSAAAMIGVVAFVVWTAPMLRLASLVTRLLPAALARFVHRQLELLASGMAVLRRPWLLLGIILTSLTQWFIMASCIYISFRAVDVEAPPSASFVVLASTVFGVMVPAAPGFFGTLHLSFVLALTPFAVSEPRAMAAAVFYHIIPYLGVTLSGLYFLRQSGVRLQQVETAALGSSC